MNARRISVISPLARPVRLAGFIVVAVMGINAIFAQAPRQAAGIDRLSQLEKTVDELRQRVSVLEKGGLQKAGADDKQSTELQSVFTLEPGGQIVVGKVFSPEQIKKHLMEQKPHSILIRAHEDSLQRQIVALLDVVRDAGVNNVRLALIRSDGTAE